MSVSLTDSKQKYDELTAFIKAHKDQKGGLMPIMQKAQEIFGYLPEEVQNHIAKGLGVPVGKVYGIASFYSQFHLEAMGEHQIGVCMGTACYVKNSQKVLDELAKQLEIEPGKTTPDGKFTLTATRCLGCCGLAPVIMVGDDVYGRLVPGDIGGILDKYRA